MTINTPSGKVAIDLSRVDAINVSTAERKLHFLFRSGHVLTLDGRMCQSDLAKLFRWWQYSISG